MSNQASISDYLPLPNGSSCIRVLDVHAPKLGEDDTHLSGDLRVVDFENNPAFSALSYVWGALSEQRRTIICHDLRIPITPSCHSALCHLRKKYGKFTIWVDAICIDQGNEREKLHQIALMGDIYTKASTVYIWLGNGDLRTDRAMDYLAKAGLLEYHCASNRSTVSRPLAAACVAFLARYSIVNHPFPLSKIPKLHRYSFLRFLHLRIFRASETPYTTFEDLKALLGREWVRRLWTYQEILLASNPVIVCGHSHLPWKRFATSVLFLDELSFPALEGITREWKIAAFGREQSLARSFPGAKPNVSPVLDSYGTFVYQFENWYGWINVAFEMLFTVAFWKITTRAIAGYGSGYMIASCAATGAWCAFRLLTSLIWSHVSDSPEGWLIKSLTEDIAYGLYSRSAGNPKDMAFGMWAVLQRWKGASLAMPSYSDRIGIIYHAFSVDLVETTRSYHLLLLATFRGVHGQPTWVPDWSAGKIHRWGDVRTLVEQTWGRVVKDEDKICELPREGLFQQDVTKRILTVRGRHLGTITNCVPGAGKAYFSGQMGVKEGQLAGHGNRKIRLGDKIVVFSGVPLPLVVRPCDDQKNSIRLISPAVLDVYIWEYFKYRVWYRQSQEDFHIH